MSKLNLAKKSLLAAVIVGISGCDVLNSGVVEPTPENRTESRGFDDSEDSILGENGLLDGIFRGGEGGGVSNALPVNRYLWRASLDTLSFLPLVSTDPFSGVIATEWGASPQAPNERVRATVFVDGKELTARAIEVSVFRETLSGSGAWVAAPVDPNTAETLKDKILLRARELRIQDVDGPRL